MFMDGVMPVLDGYESVRRFRLWEAGHRFEEPRQYIIGLTGATGEETEEEVLAPPPRTLV